MFHSIRSKVLAAIFGVTFLTALSITAAFYVKSSQMIETNYGENLYARIEQMGESFDDSLKEIYYLTVKTAYDEELQNKIQGYKQEQEDGILEDMASILRDYAKRYSEIGSVYLVIPDQQLVVTSQDYPIYEKRLKTGSVENIRQLAKKTMVPAIIQDPIRSATDILSFASQVTNEKGQIMGYVLFNMDERSLYYKYLDRLYSERAAEAVILDANRRIVSARSTEEIREPYQYEEIVKKIPAGIWEDESPDFIGVSYKMTFSGFTLAMTVDRNSVLGDLKQMRYFLAAFLAIFSGAAVVLAYIISNKMHKPIRELTKTMDDVSQGNLDKRAEIMSRDEIGSLSEEFNKMLDHINVLIEQLMQEQMLKKDAELEALQYQITPHFMYNTLNSIKYAALLKGDTEIGGLVEDFVELLQASINKKGTFVTVADELHFLENYTHLQEFRYEGRFTVEYVVAKDAESCFVPRLILQPLVENALLHGLDMKNNDSRIIIGAYVESEILYLSVADNGRGMTKEQIDKLLESKEEKKTSGLSGIGIWNVKERLELYYGSRGGLSYNSGPDGTKACISIPASRDRDRYRL